MEILRDDPSKCNTQVVTIQAAPHDASGFPGLRSMIVNDLVIFRKSNGDQGTNADLGGNVEVAGPNNG
jgi:hypothetical protein